MRLISAGQQLMTNPNPAARQAVKDLMQGLSSAEQTIAPLYFEPDRSVKLLNQKCGEVLTGKPCKFVTKDSRGSQIEVIMQVEQESDGIYLSGDLHTMSTTEWRDYTVVAICNGVVDDFQDVTDPTALDQFRLQLSQPGTVTIKFIMSDYETLVLEKN